eukprot:m.219491 g.219491  ORF g.219491 m.219491 type:complete len:263 (+) comp10175_c0_seq1:2185-2973(+)
MAGSPLRACALISFASLLSGENRFSKPNHRARIASTPRVPPDHTEKMSLSLCAPNATTVSAFNIYDTEVTGVNCPIYSAFFGVMGATAAMVFSALGAAYGTAKSGTGIAAMAVMKPELIMKSIIPIIMAGIIAIYGLVVSVLIAQGLGNATSYSLFKGFIDLGAGLSVGISGLAAGFAIGIVGDSGVRGTAQQARLFVGMILILIFAEVLGLYGLIVALILNTQGSATFSCHATCFNPCCAVAKGGDGSCPTSATSTCFYTA